MSRPRNSPISVTLPFTDRLPQRVTKRLAEWGRIEAFIEKAVILDDFMDERPWKMIVRVCAEEHLQQNVLRPIFADTNWPNTKTSNPEWLAMIIEPGHLQPPPLNPSEDFDLVLPEPCKGSLREGIPILVCNRPEGNLESAFLENKMISRRLFQVLGGESELKITGPVVYKGKILTEWLRFAPKKRCHVISEESYGSPINCAKCKTPFVAPIGVWLGKNLVGNLPTTIAEDETGCDHSRVTHPLVVSLDLAHKVEEKCRRHGYHLSPIFSDNSGTANRVRDILEDINALRHGSDES